MRRILMLTISLLVVAAALPASAGVPAIIAIEDFEYLPAGKILPATANGHGVQFDNGGAFAHTATSNGDIFDTGPIADGTSGAITIYGAGSYPYHCENHVQMDGKISMRPAASDNWVLVGESIDLRVGADFLKGVTFDVQRRRNAGDWVTVRTGIADPTPTFTFTRTGTFDFRARMHWPPGPITGWSPKKTVTVSPA